jgi:hypothetical protein
LDQLRTANIRTIEAEMDGFVAIQLDETGLALSAAIAHAETGQGKDHGRIAEDQWLVGVQSLTPRNGKRLTNFVDVQKVVVFAKYTLTLGIGEETV